MAVKLLRPRRFGDDRGWFCETYNRDRYDALGVSVVFIQDNHSMSSDINTLRGLHWQAPPNGQDKLVRCVRGAIWDVAVDVRRGSPTFGRWVAQELSADNGYQLFIPVGFAHGFLTLAADTEVEYKVSGAYCPAAEGGVIWNDPGLSLPWPLTVEAPVLSAKDKVLPLLDAVQTPFTFEGQPLEPLQ